MRQYRMGECWGRYRPTGPPREKCPGGLINTTGMGDKVDRQEGPSGRADWEDRWEGPTGRTDRGTDREGDRQGQSGGGKEDRQGGPTQGPIGDR